MWNRAHTILYLCVCVCACVHSIHSTVNQFRWACWSLNRVVYRVQRIVYIQISLCGCLLLYIQSYNVHTYVQASVLGRAMTNKLTLIVVYKTIVPVLTTGYRCVEYCTRDGTFAVASIISFLYVCDSLPSSFKKNMRCSLKQIQDRLFRALHTLKASMDIVCTSNALSSRKQNFFFWKQCNIFSINRIYGICQRFKVVLCFYPFIMASKMESLK